MTMHLFASKLGFLIMMILCSSAAMLCAES
jgi:hypothetical protein